MPISSFRLKSTIGRNYKTEFDDTLRTKEALRDLSYYEEPSYGMTGYPDEALFTAIEKFQSDNGLRRDGIMKPSGETETAIDGQLTAANNNNNESESGDEQLAQVPYIPPVGAVGPAINGSIGLGVGQRKSRNDNMGIVDPISPLPDPVEPLKVPDRTELTPPNIKQTDLTNPIPEKLDDGIYINKIPDEDFLHFGQIVHANENELTKQETRDLKKRIDAAQSDWSFLGFEYHIPGPLGGELGALMRGKAKGDGRQGGHFADMAYLTSEGNLVLVQTVDVDSNGNVRERELRNANSMYRLARNSDRDVHIILEKKQWQLQRNKSPGGK